MNYAKLSKDNVLVTYPYTYDNLQADNPSSIYDSRFDLLGWFNQTETAANFNLVEVAVAEAPTYNVATHNLVQKTSPSKIGDVWTVGWDIVDKTAEEKAAYASLTVGA
jgi:hypothetical protein